MCFAYIVVVFVHLMPRFEIDLLVNYFVVRRFDKTQVFLRSFKYLFLNIEKTVNGIPAILIVFLKSTYEGLLLSLWQRYGFYVLAHSS